MLTTYCLDASSDFLLLKGCQSLRKRWTKWCKNYYQDVSSTILHFKNLGVPTSKGMYFFLTGEPQQDQSQQHQTKRRTSPQTFAQMVNDFKKSNTRYKYIYKYIYILLNVDLFITNILSSFSVGKSGKNIFSRRPPKNLYHRNITCNRCGRKMYLR